MQQKKRLMIWRGSGVVAPAPSFPNTYSLDLDGVDEYVETSSPYSVLDGKDTCTISLWIKPDSATNYYFLLQNRRNTTSNQGQFFVWTTNTGLVVCSVETNSYGVQTGTGMLVAGVWMHILICIDYGLPAYSEGVIFINGVDQTSSQNMHGRTAFLTATNSLLFGKETNNYLPRFAGLMDEVAIWDTDQRANKDEIYSASGAVDLANLATAPAPNSWWRMGDSTKALYFNSIWQIPNEMELNFSQYSFDFDGVDDSVNCGGNFAFTDEITVSCWIKIDVWVTYDAIVVQENASGSFYLRQHQSSLNALNFAIYQSDATWKSITVNGAAPVSDWFHLVGVADGSYVRMYVDGVSVGTPVAYDGTIRTSTDDLVIGDTAAGGRAANCLIDEVAIWNGTGLSAAQVLSLYNSGTPTDLSSFEVAPVAYYRMGENSVFSDNSEWQVPNYKKIDNFSNLSCYFDGVDDYVTIYNGASGSGPILFNAGDSFSMSVWVKTSSTAAQNQIISFRGTALIWFYTFVTSGNIRFQMYLRDDSSNTVNISSYNTSSGWITPDAWTNLIFTRNGSTNTMNLYLNGVAAQVPTSDTTSDDFTLYDKLSIGNDNHSGGRYWFDGSMDSMSIWDKELSAAEVTAIYNSGVPTDLSEESNLVGYWRMGEGATWIDLPAPLPDSWSIPDDSTNSNNGTTVGMGADAVRNQAPDNMSQGLSSGMSISNRITNAPDNTTQANSVNMEEADRVEDTP